MEKYLAQVLEVNMYDPSIATEALLSTEDVTRHASVEDQIAYEVLSASKENQDNKQESSESSLPFTLTTQNNKTFDLYIDAESFGRPKSRVFFTALKIWFYQLSKEQVVRITIGGYVNSVASTDEYLYFMTLPLLGAVYNTRAETIFLANSLQFAQTAYFMLACRKIVYTKYGTVILSLPANLEASVQTSLFKDFITECLVPRGLETGLLIQEEADALIRGEIITIEQEKLLERLCD